MADIELNTPVSNVVRKVEEYVVNNLGKVAVLTAIDPDMADKEKLPRVIYQGFAMLGAKLPNGQIMEIPVEFDIDATDIKDAFAKFKPLATAQLKKHMDEARKMSERQQIQTAPANLKLK